MHSSDPLFIAIAAAVIATIPPTLAAILAAVFSSRSQRKIDEAHKAINEIHISVNSKFDRLLAVTAEASHAAGVLEGRTVAEEKQTLDRATEAAQKAVHDAGVAEGKAGTLEKLVVALALAGQIVLLGFYSSLR